MTEELRERVAKAMALRRGWLWDYLTDEPERWDDVDEGKNWWREMADVALAELASPPPTTTPVDDRVATSNPVDDADEAYELGRRDGYSEALADVDRRTGGDGEYFFSTIPGRGCADEDDMMQKIVDRFNDRETPSGQAMEEIVEAIPDYIELFRIVQAAGRSDREKAEALDRCLGPIRAALTTAIPLRHRNGRGSWLGCVMRPPRLRRSER